jgi:hypothetical protein
MDGGESGGHLDRRPRHADGATRLRRVVRDRERQSLDRWIDRTLTQLDTAEIGFRVVSGVRPARFVADDEHPSIGRRQDPDRVRSGRDERSTDPQRLCIVERGRFVGARTPDAAERHECAEDRSSSSRGTSIRNRYFRAVDDRGCLLAGADAILLTRFTDARNEGACDSTHCDRRSPHASSATIRGSTSTEPRPPEPSVGLRQPHILLGQPFNGFLLPWS